MHAARDAGERNVAMQMGRRGDGDGVDAEREQRIDVADGAAAQRIGDKLGLLGVRVGDADELGARQTSENARMVRTHHADADDSHAQCALRIVLDGLNHTNFGPDSLIEIPRQPLARRRAAGDGFVSRRQTLFTSIGYAVLLRK